MYEDRPIIMGSSSLVQAVRWRAFTVRERRLLLAETGAVGHILSQDRLVVAKRHPGMPDTERGDSIRHDAIWRSAST